MTQCMEYSIFVRLPSAIFLISLSLFGALFSSCADKDINSYRNDRAMQEAAKNGVIAGTYRGSLTAVRDQAYLGDVNLSITSDLRAVDSQDRLTTEKQAVIFAKLMLIGGQASVLKEFRLCQYDAASGSFSCDDSTNTVKLKGTIQNGTFTGFVEANGESDYGAQMTLSRNTPAAELASVRDRLRGNADRTAPWSQNYAGTLRFSDGVARRYKLSVTLPEASTEQAFNNLLQDAKTVNAALTSERGLLIGFPNANLHDSVGTLLGLSSAGYEGGRLHLSCTRTPQAEFLCDIYSDKNTTMFRKVLFTPVNEN